MDWTDDPTEEHRTRQSWGIKDNVPLLKHPNTSVSRKGTKAFPFYKRTFHFSVYEHVNASTLAKQETWCLILKGEKKYIFRKRTGARRRGKNNNFISIKRLLTIDNDRVCTLLLMLISNRHLTLFKLHCDGPLCDVRIDFWWTR